MTFTETPIAGLWIIDLDVIGDARGSFARLFAAEAFEARGLEHRLVHINQAVNTHAGTLRGLHFQHEPHAENKLVRCVAGAIFDVVVDLRQESATYRQSFQIELDARSGRQLYVPKGLAHGYQALYPNTVLNYFVTAPYTPAYADGLRWDDPALGIDWPLEPVRLSEQDRRWPLLGDPRASGS